MAVPVIEGNAITNVTSNATSTSVTLPSGVSAGDIIIIIVALDGNAGNPQSSGGISMTQFGGTSEGSVELFYLWGRASGGETAQTITWTGNEQGRFMALRISGCLKVGSPLDITGAGNTGVGTTNAVTAITSTQIDTLAVCAVAVDRDRVDGADGLATANGFSEVGTSGSSGGANGAGLIVAEKDLASIGSSLSPTFGTWQSDGHASRMFNLLRDVEVTKTYSIDSVFHQLDRQITYGIDAYFGEPPDVTWHGFIPQPLF